MSDEKITPLLRVRLSRKHRMQRRSVGVIFFSLFTNRLLRIV